MDGLEKAPLVSSSMVFAPCKLVPNNVIKTGLPQILFIPVQRLLGHHHVRKQARHRLSGHALNGLSPPSAGPFSLSGAAAIAPSQALFI